MDERTLKALVSAGAVKRVRFIGDGALFHVEADTPNGSVPALTLKGTPKTYNDRTEITQSDRIASGRCCWHCRYYIRATEELSSLAR